MSGDSVVWKTLKGTGADEPVGFSPQASHWWRIEVEYRPPPEYQFPARVRGYDDLDDEYLVNIEIESDTAPHLWIDCRFVTIDCPDVAEIRYAFVCCEKPVSDD